MSLPGYKLSVVEYPHKAILLSHFDESQILSGLMVDIERFALGEFFSILHEEVGGAFDVNSWSAMTDALTEEHLKLNYFIRSKLDAKKQDAPFEFHQWIEPTSGLAVVKGCESQVPKDYELYQGSPWWKGSEYSISSPDRDCPLLPF